METRRLKDDRVVLTCSAEEADLIERGLGLIIDGQGIEGGEYAAEQLLHELCLADHAAIEDGSCACRASVPFELHVWEVSEGDGAYHCALCGGVLLLGDTPSCQGSLYVRCAQCDAKVVAVNPALSWSHLRAAVERQGAPPLNH